MPPSSPSDFHESSRSTETGLIEMLLVSPSTSTWLTRADFWPTVKADNLKTLAEKGRGLVASIDAVIPPIQSDKEVSPLIDQAQVQLPLLCVKDCLIYSIG